MGYSIKAQHCAKECFPLGLCTRNPETGEIEPLAYIDRQLYRATIDSLMREAQTLASLNHERIVRVYDVFESHGSVIYVMPWLEGGSLKERMEEAAGGAPITPRQAREWLLQLLDGLEYLHGKGIIHRDIKPGNILFDERGMPVLIDFGAALNKPNASQTISQGEFSYAYAAPEQVTGKGEIGPWTDFYSLAATWYALISGNAVEQSLQRLMQDDLTPLAAMKPAPCADKSLLAAIDKNLNLPIAQRCQTATEWRAMLSARGAHARRADRVVLCVVTCAFGALGVWESLNRDENPPEQTTQKPDAVVTESLPPESVEEKIIADVLKHIRWNENVEQINKHMDELRRTMPKVRELVEKDMPKATSELMKLSDPKEIAAMVQRDIVEKWSNNEPVATCKGHMERADDLLKSLEPDSWVKSYPVKNKDEADAVFNIGLRQGRELEKLKKTYSALKKEWETCFSGQVKTVWNMAAQQAKKVYEKKYKLDLSKSDTPIEKMRNELKQKALDYTYRKNEFYRRVIDEFFSVPDEKLSKWKVTRALQLEQEARPLVKEMSMLDGMQMEIFRMIEESYRRDPGARARASRSGWVVDELEFWEGEDVRDRIMELIEIRKPSVNFWDEEF